MSEALQICPVCGRVLADWLDGNCPTCLMRLGDSTVLPGVRPSSGAETREGKSGQEHSSAAGRSDVAAPGDGRTPPEFGSMEKPPAGPTSSGDVRRLGGYELLEEIARGGMGVVYRARQVRLNRLVAVKVLLGGSFANPSFIQRFRREAEAAASLSHPNIVSIHEVGEHEGQPYFSMELIEGRSLAELTRDQPPPARQAAQWVKTIAEAVHYAHERGVLHRDLKPSNVLLDAQGVPHVTDFGLAKYVAQASPPASLGGVPAALPDSGRGRPENPQAGTPALHDLTLTGQVLGSPNYMPPEQADPKRGPTTAASDVYSLGAIFYHLLTGRPPFLAESMTQTLRQVVESEPVAPQLLNPALSRDLETICLKCLEKDPQRRYLTARDLAEELGRFLNDEPIQARPVSRLGRLLRWRRRKPALAASMGAGAVLLLVVAIGSPIALVRIENARAAAELARQQEAALRVRAESAEHETQQRLYTALFEQARATVLSGEMGQRLRALDALRRAAVISNSVELRREVFAALALPDLRFERELVQDPGMTLVRLDPAFERIALGRGKGPVEIRSVSDNQLLATLPASTNLPAYDREWSADGRFLAVKRDLDSAGWYADWEVWDVAGARRVLLVRNVSFSAFSFHPRLPRLIARQRTEGTVIWDLDDGRALVRFPLVGGASILRFSPEGGRFAAVSLLNAGRLVSVHDATNPEAAELASHSFKDAVDTVSWHPEGHSLVVPDHGGGVHWMDAQTGEIELLGRHKWQAVRAVFSPDGAYLFTGGWEKDLICWDARTKRRAFTASLNSHTMQFSADGRRCAVYAPPMVHLHSFERPTVHREFAEDLGVHLRRAGISQDGRWLAASADQGAGIWDLSGGGPGAIETNAYNTHFFFTPDSRELFGSRNTLGVAAGFRWQLTSPANAAAPPGLTRLPLHQPRDFTSLCLVSNSVVMTSSKGSQLLAPEEMAAGSDRWARTYAGNNGISPDGRWLGIYRSFTASLYIHRLPGIERVAKLTHPANFSDFEFSPRGDEVAIASSRAGVEFWSTTTWQRTRLLTNFSRVLYTPDARALWLSKNERTSGLHDARTLEPLLLLPTGMLPLALSPDGQRVVVSVDAQRLQIWDLAVLREQLRELGMDWSR